MDKYAQGWADACIYISRELHVRSDQLVSKPTAPTMAWVFAARFASWVQAQAGLGAGQPEKKAGSDLDSPTKPIVKPT